MLVIDHHMIDPDLYSKHRLVPHRPSTTAFLNDFPSAEEEAMLFIVERLYWSYINQKRVYSLGGREWMVGRSLGGEK